MRPLYERNHMISRKIRYTQVRTLLSAANVANNIGCGKLSTKLMRRSIRVIEIQIKKQS
jgi:hypothetical protein